METTTRPHLVRWGYINTNSSAGKPTQVSFLPEQVVSARVWVNTYGNPSYALLIEGPLGLSDGSEMADGRAATLFLVDDYGAMNGLRVSPYAVKRRRDLFRGWM